MVIVCAMDNCRRKLRLSDEYACQCGKFFCKIHKFRVDHVCEYDYKKAHKEKLKKDNVKLDVGKITPI